MFQTNSKTHGFLMRYGAIAATAALIVSAGGWIFSRPLPSSIPSMPPSMPGAGPCRSCAALQRVPPHAAPAAPAQPAPARSATVAHSTTTAPTPAVALGPVMLPAQPAPAGLRRGFALRAIASSPTPAVYGDQPVWTALASETEAAATGSWSTAIPAALRSIAPSSGLVQTQLTASIRVATAGAHVLILSVSGGPAKAALTIDGQAIPLAQITRTCSAFTGCPQNPSTGAGSVMLAAGLHVLTLTATTAVGDEAATLDVYMRGPTAAMPVAIVPWAVPAGTGGSTAAVPEMAPTTPHCWRPSKSPSPAGATSLPPCATAGVAP